MPDEINIKSSPESGSGPAPLGPQNQTISFDRTFLTNLCALGLLGSFFLPWAVFFGANVSGFDLQKLGDKQRLLWTIPCFSVITILAGVINRSQKLAGELTGIVPFAVGVYWYSKLGGDMFHILSYGAYLSLAFGAALVILSSKSK